MVVAWLQLNWGVRRRAVTRTVIVAALALAAGCSVFTDGAVDLAGCIGKGVDEMSRNVNATSQVICPVRANRPVTAILYPGGGGVPSERQVTALRQMGVPTDALYYSGPDAPSVGHLVGLGQVNVYDGHYTDNRKYSMSGTNARIRNLTAKTADRFTVLLRRQADGVVEVVGLR
jgi:hypothetical protein